MTRREKQYAKAMRGMDESYRDTVLRHFVPGTTEIEPYPGASAKRSRASLRCALETRRFNRNSLRALERGGFDAMFEFQHNFSWKHDKYWRRYFG